MATDFPIQLISCLAYLMTPHYLTTAHKPQTCLLGFTKELQGGRHCFFFKGFDYLSCIAEVKGIRIQVTSEARALYAKYKISVKLKPEKDCRTLREGSVRRWRGAVIRRIKRLVQCNARITFVLSCKRALTTPVHYPIQA